MKPGCMFLKVIHVSVQHPQLEIRVPASFVLLGTLSHGVVLWDSQQQVFVGDAELIKKGFCSIVVIIREQVVKGRSCFLVAFVGEIISSEKDHVEYPRRRDSRPHGWIGLLGMVGFGNPDFAVVASETWSVVSCNRGLPLSRDLSLWVKSVE